MFRQKVISRKGANLPAGRQGRILIATRTHLVFKVAKREQTVRYPTIPVSFLSG